MAGKAHTGPLYPEADLVPDENDELIGSAELEQIGLFGSLKRKIKVEEAPGSLLLRRFLKGEVICRQGEPGHSAFYLVPAEDIVRLRQYQLAQQAGSESTDRVERWQRDIDWLTQWIAEAGLVRQRVVARAYLLFEGDRPKRSFWPWRRVHRQTGSPLMPESISVDGPSEINATTRNAPLYEDDIFGEMSCLMFTPRSATVIAERECFAVEFRRNILDSLQREESFRRRVDAAYRERVLNSHLRRLQFLEDLTDDELEFLRPHAELIMANPGDVLFEEGDPPDAAYIVRSGLVQIVQNLDVTLKPEHISSWAAMCRRILVERLASSTAGSAAVGGAPAAAPKPSAADILAQARAAAAKRQAASEAGPSTAPASATSQEPPTPRPSVRPAGSVATEAAAATVTSPASAAAAVSSTPSTANEAAKSQGDEPATFLVSEQSATANLTPLGWLWQWFSPPVQQAVERIAASEQPAVDDCQLVAKALNQIARQRKWLAGSPLKKIWSDPSVADLVSTLPRGLEGIGKDWTDVDVRLAGRAVLHALLPDFVPSRARAAPPPRIIRYMGRGECFGELAVVQQTPRTASAIAYDHPTDDQRRTASRVELVRIQADHFREFLHRVPRVAQRVENLLAKYRQEDIRRQARPAWTSESLLSSPEFRDEGLAQGQKLLLIDLDRCTRCGDCVRACIRTHDDGRTRLFLDGPRFDRFLIPAACRQCRDPLCMIGCPVGSIQRGDNGQIVIRQWCIGCGLCARQCPYDSIQMYDLGLIPEAAPGWRMLPESAVEGQPWWQPGFSARDWPSFDAPLRWSPTVAAIFAQHAGDGATWLKAQRLPAPLCLRYQFQAERLDTHRLGYLLECETKVGQLEVWLNGQPCPLERGSARLPQSAVAAGKNVLALRLSPSEKGSPLPYDAPFLRVWLGALPEVGELTRQFIEDLEAANFKIQAARAVVCDLCSDLPGQQPACVAECPHAAAMRVDAFFEFPSIS